MAKGKKKWGGIEARGIGGRGKGAVEWDTKRIEGKELFLNSAQEQSPEVISGKTTRGKKMWMQEKSAENARQTRYQEFTKGRRLGSPVGGHA